MSQLTWPSLNSWRTQKWRCALQQHLLLCRGVTKVGERVQCLTRLLCSESYETFHCSRVRCHLSFNGKVTVTCRDLTAKTTDVTVKLNENAPWKQLSVIAGAGFTWKPPSMKSWHQMPRQILHQSFFLILQSDNCFVKSRIEESLLVCLAKILYICLCTGWVDWNHSDMCITMKLQPGCVVQHKIWKQSRCESVSVFSANFQQESK